MTRDLMICKRIMLQLAQNGHFVSETLEEAYHVALLVDRGYVDAKIETNDKGIPVKAVVGRLTAIGHDALEGEFSESKVEQPSGMSPEEYYKILVENKHNNETARDKMLATIATGGIGLLFGIVSYLKTNGIVFKPMPWLVTLGLWTWVLMGLLISDHLGGKSIDKCIEHLYDSNADVMHKPTLFDSIAEWLNGFNCIAVILGVASFVWFLMTIA